MLNTVGSLAGSFSARFLLISLVGKEAGNIIGINVLDHIVMGADRYFSFIDEELI